LIQVCGGGFLAQKLAGAKSLFFPVLVKKFPVTGTKIPSSVAQGISLQHTEIAGVFGLKKRQIGRFRRDSL